MKIKHKLYILLAVLLVISQTGTLYAQNAKTKKAVKEEGKEIAKEELAKYEDLAQAVEELQKTKKQLEEAKKEIDEAKKTVKQAQKIRKGLKEGISPEELLLGIFPNTDGFMDGKFSYKKNYLTYCSSGISTDYSSTNDKVKESGKLESSTLKKEIKAELEALGFTVPFEFSEKTIFGLKFIANGTYLFNNLDTSGYKIDQGQTVYFNTKKNIHSLIPTVDLGLNGVSTEYFSVSLSGGYLPLVYIYERGEKKYSTYDNPIKYNLRNTNTGYHAQGSIIFQNLPIGNFEIFGKLMNFGGNYQTRQELIIGNYKTTIKTDTDYTRRLIDIGINHKMTYLAEFSGYAPVVSVQYSKNKETLDDNVLFDESVYKFGFSLSIE